MTIRCVALRTAAALVAFAACACSSSSNRFIYVDSFPQGADVKVGADGRTEGQTPFGPFNVVIPENGSKVLLLEKAGYQSVALEVSELTSDHVFVCLQKGLDSDRILAALQELQKSVNEIGAAVKTIRGKLDKQGGN